MRTHVRAAAAALLLTGLIAGCAQTTTGTVAMTTEPGPATTRSSTPPTTPRTSTRSSTPRTSSNVPAPANSLTITCADYINLDEATQLAVIGKILDQKGSVLGPGNAEIAKSLADAVCQFLPKSKVSEILVGGPVP